MHILLWQRPGSSTEGGRLPLDQLLPRCDIISLHCPLSETTRNLIGASQFEIMRPDAILINTARGGIVDEQALADALRRGAIAGAGIDVLAEEPPRSPNPLLDEDIPNLIVTPHIAWASRETRQRLINEVATNIDAFVAGHPRNVVTA
jgi:glycerate dehydrogenase